MRPADRHGPAPGGTETVGPFNCLAYRVLGAVPRPASLRRGMPMLTYHSGGYAVAPAFQRKVGARIRRVPVHDPRGCADAVPVAGG